MARTKPSTQSAPAAPTVIIPDDSYLIPDLSGPRHPIAKCKWCGEAFVQVFHRTAWICPTVACHTKQFKYAMLNDAGTRYIYVPTIASFELHDCRLPNLMWGGAAGGSKTHGLRWDLYYWCRRIENMKCLLLRRSYPELESTHLQEMIREQNVLPNANYSRGDRTMHFEDTGSFIRAGHCDSVSDMTKMLSTEYDRICFDEGTTFEEKQLSEISSRARTSNTAVDEFAGGAAVRIGTNPGGVGAPYLYDTFIAKEPDRDVYPDYDPSLYHFIPATVFDNPYLDQKYISRLKQLPKSRQKQLLDGDWGAFEGQFFPMFNVARDVVSA